MDATKIKIARNRDKSERETEGDKYFRSSDIKLESAVKAKVNYNGA